MEELSSDVIIVGGGLAGMCAAIELLDKGRRVLMLERAGEERLGGLAKDSFGGIFIVGSPEQKRLGIQDSVDLARSDWLSTAEFDEHDEWPRAWAEKYVGECREKVYAWLRAHDVSFFPFVHWVERGMFKPGNSVPRFHMVWGTGHGLIEALAKHLLHHKNVKLLDLRYHHFVKELTVGRNGASGCMGTNTATKTPFKASASAVVIAAGGIGGDIERVKKLWGRGNAPKVLLNGAWPTSDGLMHDATVKVKGVLTHMDRMWNYAAGVHHPRPKFDGHGLSLVPPKSALWVNANGRRIGPIPLITAYDTKHLVDKVCEQPGKYSWQIMNQKIALKELAVSGSEFNDAIKNKQFFRFILTILTGNTTLVEDLKANCVDFVTANSVAELARKMNEVNGDKAVDAALLESEIRLYDDNIARGPKYHNDDQIRRIAHVRQYRGDRLRTCKFQPIVDSSAMPLIAIREFILARKSLGGIQTDTHSRVLTRSGEPIPGLYAVGEVAGFGGGGIHGIGALEGTFLGSCVLTGREAASHIAS